MNSYQVFEEIGKSFNEFNISWDDKNGWIIKVEHIKFASPGSTSLDQVLSDFLQYFTKLYIKNNK